MTSQQDRLQKAVEHARSQTYGAVILKHGTEKHSAGNVIISDLMTGRVLSEGYVRQCIHCAYTWQHKPGSGTVRGYCKRCDGYLCGRPHCWTCYHKEKKIDDMEAIALANKRAIEAAVRQHDLRELIATSRQPTRRERIG